MIQGYLKESSRSMRGINEAILEILFTKPTGPMMRSEDFITVRMDRMTMSQDIQEHEPSEVECTPDRRSLDRNRLFDPNDSYSSI